MATLTLTKTAGTPVDVNANGLVDAGDQVGYSFAVTNTGAVTLTALAIVDPKVGGTTCPATTLAPGRVDDVHDHRAYTLTQADVDAGRVNNTATATTKNPARCDGHLRELERDGDTSTQSALALTKTAGNPVDVNGNGRVDAGDRITYTFRVDNTGVTTVTSVAIVDAKVGATTCPSTTLAPGASHDLHDDHGLHDHPGRRRRRDDHQHRHRDRAQPGRDHGHLEQLARRRPRPRRRRRSA